MKTRIKTAHEEEYTNSKEKKIIGVLFNYSYELEHEDWKESFTYIYKQGMYIFFDTIIEMMDYLMYGETKMKRAYIQEQDFDELYDAHDIDGKFGEKLSWLNEKVPE